MSRKYFGTDGVRGLVGQYPITPDFALKLGWAAGRAMASQGNASVVVGKDTRLSGYVFESALESGLSAAGVSVRLLGPIPTPAVAHLTRAFHASAGIVISASHNPYYDNGIKFFGADGKKLSDAVELEIEAWMDREMTIDHPDRLGKVIRQEDARGRYIEFCKSALPFSMSLAMATAFSTMARKVSAGEARISTAPRRLSRISEGVSPMRTNFASLNTAGDP